jgi:predicted RNA polymerase sigma factor
MCPVAGSTACYQRLLGQLFAVTGDLAEAENLLQEAYARAFARWAQVHAYDARRRGCGGWR